MLDRPWLQSQVTVEGQNKIQFNMVSTYFDSQFSHFVSYP